MLTCEITSGAETEFVKRRRGELSEGALYTRRGPGGCVGVVTLNGTLGGDVDGLDIEEAFEAALLESGPVVLRIDSPGGSADFVSFLRPAIVAAQAAGRMVSAFIERAYGAAYFLAAECSPIIIDPRGSVGHFAVNHYAFGEWARAEVEAEAWERVLERRPAVTRELLERYRGAEMGPEIAEAVDVVDGVSRLIPFLNGRGR